MFSVSFIDSLIKFIKNATTVRGHNYDSLAKFDLITLISINSLLHSFFFISYYNSNAYDDASCTVVDVFNESLIIYLVNFTVSSQV